MWRQNQLWNLLLLAANILLLIGIVRVWSSSEHDVEPALSRPKFAVPQVPSLRQEQPLSAFQPIVAKNLFNAQRRGYQTCPANGEGQDSLEGSSLLGIVIIGEKKAALLGQNNPRGISEVEVVHLGEFWQGMKVVEICKDAVVFQGREGPRILTFPSPEKGLKAGESPESSSAVVVPPDISPPPEKPSKKPI